MLLSKSDFKIGRTCPTKLYYRKLRYRTVNEDDPYLQFLADGGYIVEAIARVRYPEGKEVAGDSAEDRFAQTKRLLKRKNVTLFQATLIYDQLLAEIDILEKRGNRFKLIEVKAKSFEPGKGSSPFRGTRGKIASKWKPYLEDLAFQTHILSNLFPKAKVIPHLCVVDKSQTSNSDTVFENFQIEPRAQAKDGGFRKPQITVAGNVKALRKESFVRILDARSEVAELLPVVKAEAAKLAASVAGEKPVRIGPVLGIVCKDCEFRTKSDDKNGFRECWGELAGPSPHILDLYYANDLKAKNLADMLAKGRASLADLSPKLFSGKRGVRQALQLKWSRRNKEFIDSKLREILAARKYPLHFLDFEASRLAVPYHAGMHPYGQVAFQWSCHTICKPDADVEHSDWINLEDKYPNFDFARSLKEVVTGEGTVFVWSPFERLALKDIRGQMTTRRERDRDLMEWLQLMIDKNGPLVDLCELARDYYFHPDMGGSVSIKKVLPAVWSNNASLRSHRWFKEYLQERGGQIVDPYKTLPSLAFEDSEEDLEAVREGTAAVRTYQELMYGQRRANENFRNKMKQLLLNYCKLDTAAMLMIWMHWTGAYKNAELLRAVEL